MSKKLTRNFSNLSLNKKGIQFMKWWAMMGARSFSPKWTRWWPNEDWAWNDNESKFYNEISHHPASGFSKEQNAFPSLAITREADALDERKKCKQSQCAGIEALTWKWWCRSFGKIEWNWDENLIFEETRQERRSRNSRDEN